MKNRKNAANDKIEKVPPKKLEPDAQRARGHNNGYVKEHDTIHAQRLKLVKLSNNPMDETT